MSIAGVKGYELPEELMNIVCDYIDPVAAAELTFEELVDDIEGIYEKELKLDTITIH